MDDKGEGGTAASEAGAAHGLEVEKRESAPIKEENDLLIGHIFEGVSLSRSRNILSKPVLHKQRKRRERS